MMSFTIKGATEFITALKSISADLKGTGMQDILSELGTNVVSLAQDKAPVDTGFLRDNISITEESPTRVVVTSEADYSIYVEEGTSRAPAQPFMGPAVQETQNQTQTIAGKHVKMIITKHWKG